MLEERTHRACEGEIVRGLRGELFGVRVIAMNESDEGTTRMGAHTGLHAASLSASASSDD